MRMEARGRSIWSRCAFVSWMQTTSASCPASHSKKPLRWRRADAVRVQGDDAHGARSIKYAPMHQPDFIRLCLELGVLRFGEFTLKSGRLSPYFFNAGLFNTGRAIASLGRYYARAAALSGVAVRHAVRPGLQGHPARHDDGRGAGRARRPQPALRLQPQGSQGPRRGRHDRRRAARGPRADRRRRDHGRHGHPRVGRDHPRARARRRPAC